MKTVYIKEIHHITNDPLTGQEDKLLIIYELEGREYRVKIPWQDIKSESDVKSILKDIIKDIKPPKKVINLTSKWKGEYKV